VVYIRCYEIIDELEVHVDRKAPPEGTAEPVFSASLISQRQQRPEAITCPWCGKTVRVKARGRTPTWCSDGCRHRAWEQSRAAASGRSAVQVVERPMVVERTTRFLVPKPPRGAEWAETLRSLTRQVDNGRLYDRDLRPVAQATADLNHALERRLQRHRLPRRYY
jgi:hypothetical protein